MNFLQNWLLNFCTGLSSILLGSLLHKRTCFVHWQHVSTTRTEIACLKKFLLRRPLFCLFSFLSGIDHCTTSIAFNSNILTISMKHCSRHEYETRIHDFEFLRKNIYRISVIDFLLLYFIFWCYIKRKVKQFIGDVDPCI